MYAHICGHASVCACADDGGQCLVFSIALHIFRLLLIFFWHTDFETWPLGMMDLYSFKFQEVFDNLRFLQSDILIHLKHHFYYIVFGNFIHEYNVLRSISILTPTTSPRLPLALLPTSCLLHFDFYHPLNPFSGLYVHEYRAISRSMGNPTICPYLLRYGLIILSRLTLPESPRICLFLLVPQLGYKMCVTPGFYVGIGDRIQV